MISLPKRIQRPVSGILRAPRRDWPRHRKFIRAHSCVVTLAKIIDECEGPIECAHVRLGAKNNGKGIKPHDAHCISLCFRHHKESHTIGETTFANKYGLNLQDLAAQFAAISPVEEVREYGKSEFAQLNFPREAP